MARLTRKEEALLKHINANCRVTMTEVKREMEVTHSEAEKLLGILLVRALIVRKGNDFCFTTKGLNTVMRHRTMKTFTVCVGGEYPPHK